MFLVNTSFVYWACRILLVGFGSHMGFNAIIIADHGEMGRKKVQICGMDSSLKIYSPFIPFRAEFAHKKGPLGFWETISHLTVHRAQQTMESGFWGTRLLKTESLSCFSSNPDFPEHISVCANELQESRVRDPNF